MLNTQTKILLLVFAGLVLVYLLYNGGSGSTAGGSKDEQYNQLPQNMEPFTNPQSENMNVTDQQVEKDLQEGKMVPIPREKSIDYFPQRDYAPPTPSDWLKYKFNGRNKAREVNIRKSVMLVVPVVI